MTAYFVIELDVEDGPSLAEYEREVTEHVVAAGGRFSCAATTTARSRATGIPSG